MRLSARIIWLILWTVCEAEVQPCDFPQIKNGELYDEKRYKPYFPAEIGKEFYYRCNQGFVTPLRAYWEKIRCTVQGWEPTVPCRKLCETPYIKNGKLLQQRGSYIQDQSARVHCHPGYSLPNGQDTVTCTENGWSPQPKCIPVKTCSMSDIEIENGFLSESYSTYDVNRKIQYRCKQGFVRSNGETSGTITCLQNGWSTQPSCVKSCDRPVFENAVTKNNSTWFKLNDKLDYECHVGYENRYKDTKGSIICNYDGWSDKTSCYEKECSIPFLDQYLLVNPTKDKYKVGDLLKFSCQQGHLVGPDSVQCYHFGWSPSFPTCKGQVRSCDQPPELLNGEFKGTKKEEYSHGEVVEYDCKPRFLLKGTSKIQCVDGKWTTWPKCVATSRLKKCKAPTSIDPEVIFSNTYQVNHNTSMSYKCRGEQEYKHSICINGRWDPEPTCTSIEKEFCPPPPQIPNAQVMETTVKYRDGEKVSILCQDNYLIQDTEEMVCRNGTWQSLPRCVDSTGKCGRPPPIENGDITSFPLQLYAPSSSVEYQCQSYYQLEGNSKITCRNGEWSEPPKCLHPCVISEEIMKRHNITYKWISDQKLYLKSGDYVEFSCKYGYKEATKSPPFRPMCIDGHINYPSCIKKNSWFNG